MSEISALQQLIPLGPTAQHSLFMIASAITALIWDFVLTFNEEVELVWKSKWTPIKCVFIIVRYLSLSIQLITAIVLYNRSTFSDHFCRGFTYFESIAGLVLVSSTDIVLAYQAYACYGRNRTILIAITILCALGQIANYSVLFLELSSVREIATPIPEFHPIFGTCLLVSFSPNFRLLWAPKLIYQTILFGFVLTRIICIRLRAFRSGTELSPVYHVFVRDGIWAYIVICLIFSLCIGNNATAAMGGVSYVVWEYTTVSVCCCRLILNLRSLNRPSTQYITGVGDDIPFADSQQIRLKNLEIYLNTTQTQHTSD